MHIIIGILGSLVTILFLLDRLGIDIGGLNPFHWYRRRAFAKKYGSDPVYSIEDPVHVASLLVIGVAKIDGDLTAEQKRVAQEQFESEFSLDSQAASQLFGSAAHLLAAPQLIEAQLGKLAERNSDKFSTDQTKSMLDMMTRVSNADGDPSAAQRAFIDSIASQFIQKEPGQGTWS